MFTGIITDVGEILDVVQEGDLRARIATGYDPETIDIGASIACDGVCLTVVDLGPDWFEVSLIPTTLDLTTLGRAEVGAPVNLEVDVIAKYVERLLGQKDASTSD